MDLNTLLYIFYAILGLGLIVFIHELGHFLAAKKVGVKVHAFSVGFDPTIFGRKMRLFSFKWGETEYIIGLIPLGGYVKMAGESELSDEVQSGTGGQVDPEKDRWLVSKSAGARAVVFAAGAVFNIVSAMIFFLIAFSLGVKFLEPTIGLIEPNSAAWRAGIHEGDKVIKIDGKEVDEFSELMIAVALGEKDKALDITVLRGETDEHTFTVKPELNVARGINEIGIRPGTTLGIGPIVPGSPLDDAGFKEGDKIIGGRFGHLELTDQSHIIQIHPLITESDSLPFELLCERDGKPLGWKVVTPKINKDADPRPMLGVMPLFARSVKAIRPESNALSVFKPGDRITEMNGKPFISFSAQSLQKEEGRDKISLTIESADGTTKTSEFDPKDISKWVIEREIAWQSHSATLATLSEASALKKAGLETGDTIIQIGNDWISSHADVGAKASSHGKSEVELQVIRKGKRVQPPLKLEASLLTGLDKKVWDENPLVAVLRKNSASAKMGIESWSKVTKIGDQEINNWDNLREAVGKSKGNEVEVAWIDPAGAAKTGKAKLDAPEFQKYGIASENIHTLKQESSFLGAASLGAKRTWISAKWVFMTLKGLARRQVAAKNLSGPVGIVHLIVRVSDMGLGTLIYYLALISVNLGIFNLLPIPILDGGHLLFLLIEKVKGSPVSIKAQEIATTVCFFLFIGLALFVTYHDILRLLRF